MISKSGYRFSEKIMRKQKPRQRITMTFAPTRTRP